MERSKETSKDTSKETRSPTMATASAVIAVVGLIVLVSLPRLRAFALEENETDAAVLARRLAQALGDESGGTEPATLPELALGLGLRDRTDDLEWLLDGRVLRRHGYLFELARGDGDAPRALYAWPWSFGETGRLAFLACPGGDVRRHANDSGRWSGIASPPHPAEPGWDALASTDPSSW